MQSTIKLGYRVPVKALAVEDERSRWSRHATSSRFRQASAQVRASEGSGFPALGNQTAHSAGEQQNAVEAVHTIHSNDRIEIPEE